VNLNKYDIRETSPLNQPLQDWKESPAVIRLSEYLRINKQHGITLRRTGDGQPCLCFVPGLKKKEENAQRWAIAENAASLFLDAADDLKDLLRSGSLSLPALRRVLPAKQNR